jgi:hypothetical protein
MHWTLLTTFRSEQHGTCYLDDRFFLDNDRVVKAWRTTIQFFGQNLYLSQNLGISTAHVEKVR